MTNSSPDRELIADYAAKGSETAFRALVARHVDLVYATALRQLGDPGLAEEAVQNVFIALARKSPSLMGVETIAGWLHRSAILESKLRLRTELRRKHREQVAAEVAVIHHEGESPLAALVPFVDEALLNLREPDRLALMLRFFEERSLRDIGQMLGVDEDAARKRVSRALDKVTDFFRRRGLATGGVSAAALLADSAEAAPAGLAISAANAGLASGGLSSLGVVILHIMTLTKTQTALICAAMIAAPLALQWQAEAHLSREQHLAQAELANTRRKASELQTEISRTRDSILRSQADALTANARLQSLTNRARALPAAYHWDDTSPLARIPKEFLQKLDISASKNKKADLTDAVVEVLQLSHIEKQQVEDAMDRFLKQYETAQAQKMHPIAPSDVDDNGRPPEEIRGFEMSSLGDDYKNLRQDFFKELTGVLGQDRFGIFKNILGNWMPVEDDYRGISSAMAIFDSDHREVFYKPKPGDHNLGWGVINKNSHLITTIPVEEIPDYLRPQLQDWINIAQSPAEGGKQ